MKIKNSLPLIMFFVILGIFLLKYASKEMSRQMPRYLENYNDYADKMIKDKNIYYDTNKKTIHYQKEEELDRKCNTKDKQLLENTKNQDCLNYYNYKISMLNRDVIDFNNAIDPGTRERYFHLSEEPVLVRVGRRKRWIRQLQLSGINAYSHNRPSPILKSRNWEGKLFFRKSKDGISLVAGKKRLTVIKSDVTHKWVYPSSVVQYDVATGKTRVYNYNTGEWERWQRGDIAGKVVEIIYMDTGQRKAQIIYKGGSAEVKLKGNDPNFKIYINQISEGTIAQMVPEKFYPLNLGDIITFEKLSSLTGASLGGEDFFVSESSDPSLITFFKNVPDYSQGIVVKRRQFLDSSTLPYAQAVCQSVDMVVGRLSSHQEQEGDNKFDLYLTIDQDLQRQITYILRRFINHHWKKQQFRAGISVMDTNTGDVLAMGSYPTSTTQEQPGRYQYNQNLNTHGIGSIAKLFVTAAILNKVPELVNLQVPCRQFNPNAQYQKLLGIEFSKGELINIPLRGPCRSMNTRKSQDVQTRLNLSHLFQYSPNQYIIELGLLSLSIYTPDQINTLKSDEDTRRDFRWLSQVKIGDNMQLLLYNPSSGYRLSPEEVLYSVGPVAILNQKPYYGYYLREGDRILYWLEHYWVIKELEALFNLSSILQPRGRGLYEADVFNSLLDKVFQEIYGGNREIENKRPGLLPLLYAISPESAVVGINTFTNLRREFISFLLGGATNRWTNIKLCEAFSRLVTGKDIKINLLHKIRIYKNGTPKEFIVNNSRDEKIPLDPNVQAAILAAMEKTIESGGTAGKRFVIIGKKNKTSLREKLEYYNNGSRKYHLYSKTGTFKRLPRSKKNSANYVFTIASTDKGKFLDGLSVAIYLEDRGGSDIAVQLAAELIDTLFQYKGWRRYLQ